MNSALQQRLDGIRRRLAAVMDCGAGFGNECKGQEREIFVRECLSVMMPTGMRFGTGEIVDSNGFALLAFAFSLHRAMTAAVADTAPLLNYTK